MASEYCQVVVVGAGPAGLAVGACLRRRGIAPTLLERGRRPGWSWHNHYQRLHLHTVKEHSSLPYMPFARHVPRYPSRDQVTDYLESYAHAFQLSPHLGEQVRRVYPASGGWCCETDLRTYVASDIIIASGYSHTPHVPIWPGATEFPGPVLHSSAYRFAEPYRGQQVLVVGMGNTGAEIALDLAEHGARPTISVRGPIEILPRDTLGQPIQVTSIRTRRLPKLLRERFTRTAARLTFGDLTRYGLRLPGYGPITSIERYGRVPVLDVGTVSAIKAGRIAVAPGVRRFTSEGATFADGRERRFDAVVLATGFRSGVGNLVDGAAPALSERQIPRHPTGDVAGLHFVGYITSPTGMLREIGLTAIEVAQAIAHRVGSAYGAPERSATCRRNRC
jgi:cation diffusion facilitator CzcD-associated flavoprotein CzcO